MNETSLMALGAARVLEKIMHKIPALPGMTHLETIEYLCAEASDMPSSAWASNHVVEFKIERRKLKVVYTLTETTT